MGGITAPLGDALRRLRIQAGYSQRALTTVLGWPTNTRLSRYESGERTPNLETLTELLDVLDVKDSEREQLLALVRPDVAGELFGGVPSAGRQLAQLIGYERAATRITDVSPLLIPGLLQTRDYARAVIGAGADIEKRVTLRMERAEILTRPEHPVELRAITHIEALTRPTAPPPVMQEQFRHLLWMAGLPNVTLQIVPADAPGSSPSFAGPFMLIESAGTTPLVHLEHYRSSVFLWAEQDVSSYTAAVDRIAHKAMTAERTIQVITQMTRMETT